VKPSLENDQLLVECFRSTIWRCDLWEWSYRDKNGVVHTGISKTADGPKYAARIFGYRPPEFPSAES
jgi:hypothetical protein